MSIPTESDWLNTARELWNCDNDSDVWIPGTNDEVCGLFDKCDVQSTVGAWITGARVWISREQLDVYMARQRGEKVNFRFPSIEYTSRPAEAGES